MPNLHSNDDAVRMMEITQKRKTLVAKTRQKIRMARKPTRMNLQPPILKVADTKSNKLRNATKVLLEKNVITNIASELRLTSQDLKLGQHLKRY